MPRTRSTARFLRAACLALIVLVLAPVRVAFAATAASVATSTAAPAQAASPTVSVPVLLVDAGLGDAPIYLDRWLGKGPEMVASAPNSSARLWRGQRPAWWGTGSAPPTFLLASTNDTGGPVPGAISAEDIAWALDHVADVSGQAKSVILAQGAAGLQARVYLQDLATARVSRRGDVVGLIEMGTPNAGLALAKRYPSLDVWAAVAAGAGLTTSDLLPGSAWLARLDAAAGLPGAVRVGVIRGRTAVFAKRPTDGVVVPEDSIFPTAAASAEVEYADVKARATDAWPLVKSWGRKAPSSGAATDTVSDDEVGKLGPVNGYASEPAVAATVRRFYESWFSAGIPTTYVSTRLLVDTSGSMAQGWSGTTKIDGARRAAVEFVTALKARTSIAGSTPEDVGLLTFASGTVSAVRAGADSSAIGGVLARVHPRGNTDIASAIQAAVAAFQGSPRAAEKVLVLLSDGVNTEGLDDRAILAGPVALAAKQGIRIEAIAIGGAGTMDARFLKSITRATGGSYHSAKDLFELRRDFVRTRYSGLGVMAADVLLQDSGAEQRVALGTLNSQATRLEFALVPDASGAKWQLMRDGKPVAPQLVDVSVTDDGTQIGALRKPAPGRYEIVLAAGGPKRVQVFALADVAVFAAKTSAASRDDSATLMLIGLAGVAVLAVGATVTVGIMRRRRDSRAADEDPEAPEAETEEE
jgi:hypothetical protein